MIEKVSQANRLLFEAACAFERVMGSKALNSLECYGLHNPAHRFWVAHDDNNPSAALYLSGQVLLAPTNGATSPDELAQLIKEQQVAELDTSFALAQAVQNILGGTMESSFYMAHQGAMPEEDWQDIHPANDLQDVFSVLQQSHEYYRTHLTYKPWAADLQLRMQHKRCEVFQMNIGGNPMGTGSIISSDDVCGVIAAVAVIPAYRHQGYGARMSKFLTRRILDSGKKPILISGYDAVAALYRSIGYVETGRWGELYLP